MSFSTTEISNAGGAPITLYEFERDSTTWRYAVADDDVTVGETVYTALSATNESITQSGDTTQDEFKITVPITLTIAQMYLNSAPSTRLNVRVRRVHAGDTEAPVVWVGVLDRVKAISDAEAEIYCRNALASLRRGGLRLTWSRQCTHMLFDKQCTRNRAFFNRTATVLSIAGSVVTAPGLAGTPVGALLAGYLEWTTADGFIERRTITDDQDGIVTLLGGAASLTAGMSVTGYYGCVRTPEMCQDTFSNLPNYGGFPHIPSRNPFDGNPVF
jgi:uncharacterized phage protein (TIGR02218 family)